MMTCVQCAELGLTCDLLDEDEEYLKWREEQSVRSKGYWICPICKAYIPNDMDSLIAQHMRVQHT